MTERKVFDGIGCHQRPFLFYGNRDIMLRFSAEKFETGRYRDCSNRGGRFYSDPGIRVYPGMPDRTDYMGSVYVIFDCCFCGKESFEKNDGTGSDK